MSNIKLFHVNEWDVAATLSATSSNPLWPAVNTQKRWKSEAWRSRHGAGSGWGSFVIDATNNKLYFNEGGSDLTATVVNGTYSADTLATQIATQMEASGTQLYHAYFDDTARKFVIECETSPETVILLLATTTNAIWDTIGFTGAADTSAEEAHTADVVRLHTSEYVNVAWPSTVCVNGAFVFGHNLSADALVYLKTTADGWVTGDTQAMQRYGDCWVVLPTSELSATAALIEIIDRENADGYVSLGRIWMGASFVPTIGFDNKSEPNLEDNCLVDESEGGQVSGIELPMKAKLPLSFEHVTSADRVVFDALWRDRKTLYPLVVCYAIDGVWTDPEERTIYGRLKKFVWKYKSGVWSLGMEIREEG